MADQDDAFVELDAWRSIPQLRLALLSKAQKAEAKPRVNPDARNKTNLLTLAFAKTNLHQAGLGSQQYQQVINYNPLLLTEKINRLSSHPG